MKLIFSDFKKHTAKVKVENLDDLWYLNQIIEKNDIIKGKTLRKIKIGEDMFLDWDDINDKDLISFLKKNPAARLGADVLINEKDLKNNLLYKESLEIHRLSSIFYFIL